MDRRRTVELLTRSMPELRGRFGVTRLALFGSTIRDTARSDSDVDVVVAFDGQATSARHFGVQFYLEDLVRFACKVLANVEGLDQAAFVESDLTNDATLRNLELLGEAAVRVPDHVRAAHTETPWRLTFATRNR